MMVMRSVWQSSFVLLFTFSCASAATNPNCPAGWQSNTALNNNCYKPNRHFMTWMDAEFQCRIDTNLTGHLASIHNVFEANYLIEIALSMYVDVDPYCCIWIGLENFNDTTYRKNYEWIDGSRLDYTNWGYAQPDTTGEFGGLMRIHYDYVSQWYVSFVNVFGMVNPFICQISH